MPFASLSPSAVPPLALADPAPGPLGIAKRIVFDHEDTDAASAGQLAINHLSLYRSLGGGTKIPKQPVLNDKP